MVVQFHIRQVGDGSTLGYGDHVVAGDACPKCRRLLEYVDSTGASAVERKHGCRRNLEMKIMI